MRKPALRRTADAFTQVEHIEAERKRVREGGDEAAARYYETFHRSQARRLPWRRRVTQE